MMDDKGQMLIWEVIIFAAMVILSLLFLYQLSPPSIVANKYTSDLQIAGDAALHNLYRERLVRTQYPPGHPASKMEFYLLNNSYGGMVSDLNQMLPPNVMYNIYIENSTKQVFWCNSLGQGGATAAPLPNKPPVTISTCIVPMDPIHIKLINFPQTCYLFTSFAALGNVEESTYELSLEMWYI